MPNQPNSSLEVEFILIMGISMWSNVLVLQHQIIMINDMIIWIINQGAKVVNHKKGEALDNCTRARGTKEGAQYHNLKVASHVTNHKKKRR